MLAEIFKYQIKIRKAMFHSFEIHRNIHRNKFIEFTEIFTEMNIISIPGKTLFNFVFGLMLIMKGKIIGPYLKTDYGGVGKPQSLF